MENINCPCPNKRCRLHGNCAECAKRHRGKPFCKAGESKKRAVGRIFGIFRKK